jgi:diaminopimelate decarboxylase
MDDWTQDILRQVKREHGTPAYVYFLDRMLSNIQRVRGAFDGRFGISYAVKSNPNLGLIKRLLGSLDTLDVSSGGELQRALAVGCPADRVTFSGPAKRRDELELAVRVGCGEMVCESPGEIDALDELARDQGIRMPIFIRINPARAPRHFGVNMAGKPSQFGIDEEDIEPVLRSIGDWPNIDLQGFHIYSGTNCLQPQALAENFSIFIELFARCAEAADIHPRKLIFGSGFGIPYHPGDEPLDLAEVASLINPLIDDMKRNDRLAGARCMLEMGRYLVGPEGYLLSTVVASKHSRGREIRLLDGGFNAHLAAWGMMGTVIRRNWQIFNVDAEAEGPRGTYMLTGPLCTTIDMLADNIELPELKTGDAVAVGSSGAYGVSSSPIRFISQPIPREVVVVGEGASARVVDVTEPPTDVWWREAAHA